MNIGQWIGYGLLMRSCKIIGILPDWLLYGVLGRFISFVLYRVVGYRKKVVRENLWNSFPEKTVEEREAIERKFYRHLGEVFVDTLKLAAISRRNILCRMDYAQIKEHEKEVAGKSWVCAMSHFGSWELTINYSCFTDHGVLAVYRPLHDQVFERYYSKARSRFGTKPVAMNDIYKEVLRAKQPGQRPVAVAMIADQTPPWHEIKEWFRFLHQDTPFFSGMGKMAIRLKMPVYFLHVTKIASRRYKGEFIEIYDGKESIAEHDVTQRYIDRLEAMIRQTPELWMWSHRRWKHKRENWTR